MLKKITAVFSLFIIMMSFSGCGARRQINEMAYVVGVGIDKGEEEEVLLSLQFAKPMALSKGSGGGEEKGEKTQQNESTSLISAEAENVFSAMSIIESSLSKQINLTHAKLLLFSEELAREGILKYAESFIKSNQFRPNTFCAVARGGANEYLSEVKPILELNPAKYYTLVFSKNTKSFVPEVTLRDLYFNINSGAVEAVMPVVGTAKEEGGENGANQPMTGEILKTSENKTDIAGMAFLKDDKLVSVQNAKQAEIFNILTGSFKEGYLSFNSDEAVAATVKMKMRRAPKICVKKDGDSLKAEIKIKLSAEVMRCENKELSENNYSKLSEKINEEIKNSAEGFILKTKELSSDVLGFGKKAKKCFLTQRQWEEFNYKEKFFHIITNIETKTTVTGEGLVQNR